MKVKIAILLLCFTSYVYGQSIRTIKPTLGKENNYSQKESKYWKNAIDTLKLMDDIENEIDYTMLSNKTKKAIDSLEMGYGAMTWGGPGCSWYCGGGPYKVSSSSILEKNKNYFHENAHDFNLLTGWVPNSKNGIGESVSFHFKAKSPRVTAIIIYNGYVKTKALWKSNSRAKTMRLKVNGTTIAILALEDTTASQRFEFDPIPSAQDKDLILTLEVIAAYEGEKHTDLVISEINFDGIDVH